MTTEKSVNYTAEMSATVVDNFKAGMPVEEIAVLVGKSVRSVIAKLSREGVYEAKAKAKAEGRVTKADLIEKIAVKFGVASEKFDSLEKATKEALEILAA